MRISTSESLKNVVKLKLIFLSFFKKLLNDYLLSSIFLAAKNMVFNVTKSPSSSNLYSSGRNRQIVKINNSIYIMVNTTEKSKHRKGLESKWVAGWGGSVSWDPLRDAPYMTFGLVIREKSKHAAL